MWMPSASLRQQNHWPSAMLTKWPLPTSSTLSAIAHQRYRQSETRVTLRPMIMPSCFINRLLLYVLTTGTCGLYSYGPQRTTTWKGEGWHTDSRPRPADMGEERTLNISCRRLIKRTWQGSRRSLTGVWNGGLGEASSSEETAGRKRGSITMPHHLPPLPSTVPIHSPAVTITPYLSRDTTYCYRHCKGISRFPLLLHHPSPRP